MRSLLRRSSVVFFVFTAVLWCTVDGLSAQSATGTVSGSVTPTPTGGVVVWLEGVRANAWRLPHESPTITQHGAEFHPDFLVVVAGQSVTFPNDDRMAHNVFSVSPTRPFDLGHYRQGESRSVQFDRAGIVDVFCNIHDNMHATIVVVPSTFHAAPDASGHFAIDGVPPGSYRLAAYSVAAGRATRSAAVAAGGTTSVDLAFSRR